MATALIPDSLLENICLKKTEEKKYKSTVIDNVIRILCALHNSVCGGTLTLYYEDFNEPGLPVNKEQFLRSVEQKIQQTFGRLKYLLYSDVVNTCSSTIFTVKSVGRLVTLNYNMWVAHTTEVVAVLSSDPFEDVRKILKHARCEEAFKIQQTLPEVLVRDQVIGLESSCIQFKNLKAERTKSVSLADRMVNKTNKLTNYVSAFSNGCGGSVCYGVQDDGKVIGYELFEEQRNEIVKKVSKVIGKMIWLISQYKGEQLQKGKHWDIFFIPVKVTADDIQIPSTFVIVVSVAFCPGGVFTEQPESCHIVNGKIEKMEFPTWIKKVWHDKNDPGIPESTVESRFPNRTTSERRYVHANAISRPMENRAGHEWVSKESKKNYEDQTMLQERFRKTGEWESFYEELSSFVDDKLGVDNLLIRIFQSSSEAVMQGNTVQAKKIFEEFMLRKCESRNWWFFEIDEIYFELVVNRVDNIASNERADRVIKCADKGIERLSSTESCVASAWLYCEIATALSSIICECKRGVTVNEDIQGLTEKAMYCALSSMEQSRVFADGASSEVSCDIQWKVHVIIVMLHLGTASNAGAGLGSSVSITEQDLAKARENLAALKCLVRQRAPYAYNQCQRSLAECDFWYRVSQMDAEKADEHKKKAKSSAVTAKDLAKVHKFGELDRYAQQRLRECFNEVIAWLPRNPLFHERRLISK